MRQIDFVDDRDDRQILLRREMDIRDGLGFDTLRGIDNQDRAFASAQAARDFISEIDVAGSIDQIQFVFLTVFGLVQHRDRMRFDRDSPLPLEVHRVEQLVSHVASRNSAGFMQKAVRKRRLPMIDMGNDAEISNVRYIHLNNYIPTSKCRVAEHTGDVGGRKGKFEPQNPEKLQALKFQAGIKQAFAV